MAWAADNGLLESKILLTAEQKKVAHRCIVVGAVQHGVRSDSHAASEGDRVSWEPSGRCRSPNDFGIASDQCDVDRITGVAARRLRDTRRVRAGQMITEVKLRQRWHDQVGRHGPYGCGQQYRIADVDPTCHCAGRVNVMDAAIAKGEAVLRVWSRVCQFDSR